jgi:hypothetical protein
MDFKSDKNKRVCNLQHSTAAPVAYATDEPYP